MIKSKLAQEIDIEYRLKQAYKNKKTKTNSCILGKKDCDYCNYKNNCDDKK